MKIALAILFVLLLAVCLAANAYASNPALQFRPDGSFKIIQFTDVHYSKNIDPRTAALMNKILDSQKPDFVVITGDCVYVNQCATLDELKHAIDAIAQPMETKKIPWAVTLGNHDHENLPAMGITGEGMIDLYMKYPHNMNVKSPSGVSGSGNAVLTVNGSESQKPAFAVWLIDSNADAHLDINGKKVDGYDWIHLDQVEWYRQTSLALEKQYSGKIPSLMFFHIPLLELGEAVLSGGVGEMNEKSCPSFIDSGMFAAAIERGDVKGMFFGHEHNNAFAADLYGIKLGYSGTIGYDAYGLEGKNDDERNRLRGGRLFTINESYPAAFETSYMTTADFN